MKKQVLAALIGVTLTTSSWAELGAFRVTGGLGYGISNDSSPGDVEASLLEKGYDVSLSNVEDGGLGYDLWLGWQAHKYVILEVGYLDFAERSAKAPNVDESFAQALVDSLPTSGQGFAFAVRPTFDVAKGWSLYGRLGVMRWDSNLEVEGYSGGKSGTDILVGGGVEYRITRNWLTSMGWDSVKMDGTQNHLIALNVTYQFGSESQAKPLVNMSKTEDGLVEKAVVEVEPQVDEISTDLMSSSLYFDTGRYSPEFVKSTEVMLVTNQLDGKNRLLITATTDTDGSDLYNKNLANKRAQFVVNYLKQRGVSEKDMVINVIGEVEGESKFEQRKVTIELQK